MAPDQHDHQDVFGDRRLVAKRVADRDTAGSAERSINSMPVATDWTSRTFGAGG